MNKIFLVFLQIAIVSCAISVSLSQLFLFLTFILFFFTKGKESIRLTPISLLSFGVFGFYFLSFFFHFATGGELSYIAGIKGSELKDVLLFSAFLIVQNLKNEEEIAKVEKAFWILLIVLLITGFFSIFSPIRLSRLVSDLFKPSPNWKFAHHYGNLLANWSYEYSFDICWHIPIIRTICVFSIFIFHSGKEKYTI